MHLLELVVDARQFLRQRSRKSLTGLDGPADLDNTVDPVRRLGRHQRPGRRFHATREGLDVVVAEVAGAFPVRRLLVSCDVPDGCHGHVVDPAYLVDADERAVAPLVRLEALAVHPSRGVGVPLDLVVLA